MPWFAAWEFTYAGLVWHITLYWQGGPQLRPGAADPAAAPAGSRSFTAWLLDAKPQDQLVLDFGRALQRPADQAVTFWVSPLTGSGPVPGSLRGLASALGYQRHDFGSKTFGFDEVISAILRRGIVLTDNRRLPLARRSALDQLRGPVDLRDGSGVAAELYRLKNGNARENERYEEIAQTFTYLTRRTLGLRSRPRPANSDLGPGMTIEPMVIDGYGERPVEFSGAGVQEALVLSALLPGEPGRIVVLDEPAVNLEPTMQRRLISRLREAGQCLVITHSADLVPVDSPEDLDRIVRLAPGPNGTQVHRPVLRGQNAREVLAWPAPA